MIALGLSCSGFSLFLLIINNLNEKSNKKNPFSFFVFFITVFLLIGKCDRDRRVLSVITTIFEHFCEDPQGRDGHGHASESKEIL